MIIPSILFVLGLLCLIKGGDWFVDGASALARRFHLPELLIGATVVSIGTTLPEVMVSTISAVSGHGEIAYGNAIGSVICNAALIAAITVAVRPAKVDPKTLRVPVAFFFAAAAVYCFAAYGMGRFTRPLGLLMLAMFAAYMVANVWQMTRAPIRSEIRSSLRPVRKTRLQIHWQQMNLLWLAQGTVRIIYLTAEAVRRSVTEVCQHFLWFRRRHLHRTCTQNAIC